MDTPTLIQVDLGRIAQDLQIRRVQVESVVQLLDEGNTVPFITRYRKERTGNLNEVVVREIQVRVGRLRELAERKETILKSIEAQGNLTDDLLKAIRAADNPKRLEDLYLPYKPKKKTKASEAREKGLEPLALAIWNRDESLGDLNAAAASYLNPEKEVDTVEKVLEGVGHILAEMISELAPLRDAVRRVVWRTGKIVTTKAEIPEGEGLEYRDYFAYSEPASHIPPHRVLAINRGDKEGPLKVRLEVSRPEIESATLEQLPLEGHPHSEFFTKAAIDALDRLLIPSMEREVRRDLTEMAERHAVDVFARNLRSLLLQPPISKQTVLAIDPGFRTGCKVTVLDGNGNLLEHGIVHPHPPQNRRHDSKLYLKDLVGKHKVGVVAIGNGTACRETEELIAEIIAEGTQFYLSPSVPAATPTQDAEPKATETSETSQSAPLEPSAPQDAVAAPNEAVSTPDGSESSTVLSTNAPSEPPPDEATTSENTGNAQPGDARVQAPNSNENITHDPFQEPVLPPISGGAPDTDPQSEPMSAPSESTPMATVDSSEPAVEVPHPAVEQSSTQAQSPSEPENDTTAVVTARTLDGGSSLEVPPAPEESSTASSSHAAPCEASSVSNEASASSTDEAASPVDGASAPAAPTVSAAPTAKSSKPHSGPKQGPPRPPRPRQAPPPPSPHPADAQLAQLAYVIVNEAGASVYSTSPVGREEFPEFDATLRSAISIGRRLQDPLSELVKIEPQNIGVGLYQHDVNPKQLKESLESVIESCVNFVGVDLNTASVPLLQHVSGLNQLTARRVVEFRKEKGPFTNREQLKQVDGIGPVTFTQSAGFLKILGAENPLDRTWIHPESYSVAEQVLEKLGFTPDVILHRDQLPALHAKMNEADLPALARELQVGEPTLHDIFEALARPERDPRDDLPKPIFKKGVLKLEDLSPGMELKGTVLNVVDFGSFVDIGLKDSGLVHISQLANRYIKSPHDVVSVGDVVTVWVMGVDQERKRVSLTMVKPGTERPRGGQGGGRRAHGEGREGGGERRTGPARPPRREGGGGPRREGTSAPPQGAGSNVSTPSGEGQGQGPTRPADRSGSAPRGPQSQGEAGPARGPRVPGPPQRGLAGQGRGGPRPHQGPGGGQGRIERAQAPRQPSRPSKPAPPLPPLSKDALAGSVPLRTFGQLKQLWQARTEEGPPGTPEPSTESTSSPTPDTPANGPEASSPPPAASAAPDAPQTEPSHDTPPPPDQPQN
jgi:protein Tex